MNNCSPSYYPPYPLSLLSLSLSPLSPLPLLSPYPPYPLLLLLPDELQIRKNADKGERGYRGEGIRERGDTGEERGDKGENAREGIRERGDERERTVCTPNPCTRPRLERVHLAIESGGINHALWEQACRRRREHLVQHTGHLPLDKPLQARLRSVELKDVFGGILAAPERASLLQCPCEDCTEDGRATLVVRDCA